MNTASIIVYSWLISLTLFLAIWQPLNTPSIEDVSENVGIEMKEIKDEVREIREHLGFYKTDVAFYGMFFETPRLTKLKDRTDYLCKHLGLNYCGDPSGFVSFRFMMVGCRE